MLTSPFSYFRGAALPMAADLAATPVSGLAVQACGDAHLSNFGLYASPERALVFDLNDFDETLPGPWEWDVKRLAASLEVAGRDNGYRPGRRRKIVTAAVRGYREAMRSFAGQTTLAVWYARADIAELREQFGSQLSGREQKRADQDVAKARTRDSLQALSKLTRLVDGKPRIVPDPPLVVPLADLIPAQADQARLQAEITGLIAGYRRTLETDRRYLLEQFEFADMARKVVGVGSVGTRCWIVLVLGLDHSDPLFLQVKEAERSVLEDFAGTSQYANHGQRVVAGQRLMQAASDIFLGWQRSQAGPDGTPHDYYIRQLRDWKRAADIAAMAPAAMRAYGELCGWALIIDAYNDIGAAAERADASCERCDFFGRWRAACRAVRSWALEHPHQYALVYGSPVPGYRAPQDTVGSASRVTLVLAALVRDAAAAGALECPFIPKRTPEMSARAAAEGARAGAIVLEGVPADAVIRALAAWTQLFGFISFELFGHLVDVVEDCDAIFDQVVTDIGAFVGLARPAAPGRPRQHSGERQRRSQNY